MAKYSKRMYELAAACLGCAEARVRTYSDERRQAAAALTVRDITERFAFEFELDNTRFDKERFHAKIEEVTKSATGH